MCPISVGGGGQGEGGGTGGQERQAWMFVQFERRGPSWIRPGGRWPPPPPLYAPWAARAQRTMPAMENARVAWNAALQSWREGRGGGGGSGNRRRETRTAMGRFLKRTGTGIGRQTPVWEIAKSRIKKTHGEKGTFRIAESRAMVECMHSGETTSKEVTKKTASEAPDMDWMPKGRDLPFHGVGQATPF